MKLAVTTGSISRNAGGLFESVRMLSKNVLHNSLEIKVFGIHDQYSNADIGAWLPLKPLISKYVGPRMLAFCPEMLSGLRNYRPDLIHLHGLWQFSSIATQRYSQKNNVPYLISPRGMLDPWALSHSNWKKLVASAVFENFTFRDARCIHALCSAEADAVRTFGLTQRVEIIPNGVDLPDLLTKTEIKSTEGRKKLLFLGRIHPKKGLVAALKAWAKIRNSSDWQFVIAGWDQGGHEEELKRLCGDLGLQIANCRVAENLKLNSYKINTLQPEAADVVFAGPVFGDEKDTLLRSASAFILPSLSEGLPMSVLEAWAYALPVVMTPQCNLPEGFEHDAALPITNTGEADQDLVSNYSGLQTLNWLTKSELSTIGFNGRRLVENRFTWPKVANSMTSLYDDLVRFSNKRRIGKKFTSSYPIRALCVVESVSRKNGGIFEAERSLHKAMTLLDGVQTQIVGLKDSFTDEDMPKWKPLQPMVANVSGPKDWSFSMRFSTFLHPDYDLAYGATLWTYPSFALLKWQERTRKPVILAPHGSLDSWALKYSKCKKLIASIIYKNKQLRRATCFRALCPAEVDSIRAYGLKQRIEVVPNGVDLPELRIANFRIRIAKKRLLFLGRIHPKKGLVGALKVWSKIRNPQSAISNSSDWQFVIAGWDQGGYEDELKKLCVDLGLRIADCGVVENLKLNSYKLKTLQPEAEAADVVFVGPVFGDEKDSLLRSAEAFILPSFSEGLPMSVLEAWAYGLPVVMTPECNLPEGFVCHAALEIRNAEMGNEKWDGLRALIEMTDQERAAMGMRGRRLVEERFTWPKIAAQMKSLFEDVLNTA